MKVPRKLLVPLSMEEYSITHNVGVSGEEEAAAASAEGKLA